MTSLPAYAVVTVTYQPELAVLERQLAATTGAARVVLVDNASDPAIVAGLRERVQRHPQVQLLTHERNQGLAAGLNAGAKAALRACPDCAFLVFLDQDTEPGAGGLDQLVAAAAALRARDARAAVVGPQMIDAQTGLSHGIHVVRGWRWTRIYPAPNTREPMACASVNGSGMAVASTVFRELGGFDEALFIDHVDSDWSFRVLAAGYHLYVVPGVRFAHRMGQRSIRFWLGGWRVWPYRSAARHFYLFRNAATLMRRSYVPLAWKLAAPVKLLLTALVHGVADPARGEQLRAMARGVRAGVRDAASSAAGAPRA